MWEAKTHSGPSFVGKYGTIHRLPTRSAERKRKPRRGGQGRHRMQREGYSSFAFTAIRRPASSGGRERP